MDNKEEVLNINKPVIEPIMDNIIVPTMEEITPVVTENKAISDTMMATPNKMDDPALKIEDTMLSNNLKEDIKKVTPMTKEEDVKDSRRKIRWLVGSLIILGLIILALPFFVKF